LLDRLNPFAPRSNAAGSGARTTNPASGPAAVPVTIVAARPAETPAPPPAPVDFVRYAYRRPSAPQAGRRAEAEKHFARGLKAQRSGQRAQAMADYRAAIQSDPAFFEPYHNLGLAALQEGDWREALSAYEFALALRPDATDARYNFALALKSGNYPLDAADQLRRLLEVDPKDARAHLSLANLCAQQLRQPAEARTHYEKVLELSPRHPEAGRIRYWLALNP
jgi:tetratricopeptide (TPR) repeat protein